MKEDPRIILIQNDINKGALYTKSKGVLNAKGKYVMTLDKDDLYANEKSFSILYEEAEKNNLDILGFSAIQGDMGDKFYTKNFHNYFETSVIYQPELSERSILKSKSGKIIGQRDVLWAYFFKTELYIKTIKEIDDKILNRIINNCDDIIVFFLLVRRATSLKHIKNIFYVTIHKNSIQNPLIRFSNEEKQKKRKKYDCLGYLSYVEFVFQKTKNNFEEKKFASFEMNNYLLKKKCFENEIYRKKEVLEVFELFLKNEYIDNKLKNKIHKYINKINEKYLNL